MVIFFFFFINELSHPMRSIELKQNVALTKFEREKLEQTNPSGDFPFEIPF